MRFVRSTSVVAGLVIVLCAGIGPAHRSALAQSGPGEQQFEIGLQHLRDGRVDLAIEEFERAVKANEKNPYFRKALGHALASKGRYTDAIAQYRKALEINPYYVDVRNDLGTALVLSGKREEGKKEFLAAFGEPTNPTPEISAHNLGFALYEEKNYVQAMDWLRTAIGRNKAYGECYVLLSESLEALGRKEEALAQLELGVKEAPSNSAVRLALGQAYFKTGRFGEARACFDAVLKADPSGPNGRKAADLLRNLPR